MKIKTIALAFCALALMTVGAEAQKKPQSQTITILQLNDVYEISPVDGGESGGLARVATLVERERARSPHTLFLLAGDFLSPSLASKEFKGAQMVASLNALRLDAAALGNHEFDVDLQTLDQRIKESSFAYLAANVSKKDGRPIDGVKPYIIRNLGGARVAVFSLLTADTAAKSTYGKDIKVADPVSVGKRLARRLRLEGADIIIALTHLSMCEDKRLASEADVDLIVGGHEHELLQSMAGRAHISKMGSDARNLGRMDLHLSRAAQGRYRLKDMDWKSITVDKTVPENESVKQVVGQWEGRLKTKYPDLDEKIGQTTVELDVLASHLRRSETNFGNFLADAYLQAYDRADAAIVNSGGIRSDRTYGRDDATTDLAGRDIRNILPYDNNLALIEVTGELLKKLLEHGVSEVSNEDGRFPQVAGLAFSYDAAKSVGQRVTGIKVGGQPYDPQKKYRLVVNTFILGGGDGYDFAGATRLSEKGKEPVERDIVIDQIRKKSPLAPRTENRIVPAGEQAPALDPCAPRRKAA
jgi:5'-nucleotidase